MSAQPFQVPSSLYLDLASPPLPFLHLCALCDLCGENLSFQVTPLPQNALRPAPRGHRISPRHRLTPLQSALPKISAITPSESALTKWLNLKSFRIRTYEITGGRGHTILLAGQSGLGDIWFRAVQARAPSSHGVETSCGSRGERHFLTGWCRNGLRIGNRRRRGGRGVCRMESRACEQCSGNNIANGYRQKIPK